MTPFEAKARKLAKKFSGETYGGTKELVITTQERLVPEIYAALIAAKREGLETAAQESLRHSTAQFGMVEKNPVDDALHNFAGNVLETNAERIRSLKDTVK